MTAREQFEEIVDDTIEFEQTMLSVGSEFLPPCARVVRDGGEPTEGYWEWMLSQAILTAEGR